MASWVHYYSMTAGHFSATRKMIVTKQAGDEAMVRAAEGNTHCGLCYYKLETISNQGLDIFLM